MEPFMSYLCNGTLSQDLKEVDCMKKRSEWFFPYEGLFYKKAFSHPLL